MDIMQVLQDICKNPEDHDKGLNITHLMLPLCVIKLFHLMTFPTANSTL